MTTADIPSPCVSVCQIETGSSWCRGCWRTIDEIAAWGAMNPLQKRAVWKLLPLRRDAWPAQEADLFDAP